MQFSTACHPSSAGRHRTARSPPGHCFGLGRSCVMGLSFFSLVFTLAEGSVVQYLSEGSKSTVKMKMELGVAFHGSQCHFTDNDLPNG